eukprot:XP_016660458.1 PREDICTED: uncharacterized protein LOC100568502 isoform X2 [Acyrthosiphon pisum]
MAPTLRCASERKLPSKFRDETTRPQQTSSWKKFTSAKPQGKKPSNPAPNVFIWTPERSVELLNSMIGLKPSGHHKHQNILTIKERVSQRLNMNVPIKDIRKFLHDHWDLYVADRMKYEESKRRCFEEEAEEAQKAETQMSQPSTSRVLSDITK